MLNQWSCIIITCPTLSSVISTEKEICFLRRKKRILETLRILVIEDPSKNVGSGTATLNALLVATEHLSVQKNYMVISADVLNDAKILILHNGRNYLYSSTGKAFISLPLEYIPESSSNKNFASGIVSNLESTLMLIDEISNNCPYGVWVCSTDMMIQKGNENISVNYQNIADVVMFCIPSEVEYATGHGVIALDEQGFVSGICYCGSAEQIRSLAQGDEKVPLVSGIVYMTVRVAESLLSLHVQAPLDSCTYLGMDSGADPIQVSLYFDLLVALSTGISKESFIAGKCGKTYNMKAGNTQGYSKESILARTLVWDELSKYNMSIKMLSGCKHIYWDALACAQNHLNNLFQIASSSNIHSIIEGKRDSSPPFLIVNSFIKTTKLFQIERNAVIYDSVLDVHSLHIGQNSFISGISIINSDSLLYIPDNLAIINVCVKHGAKNFILMFGVNENLMDFVDIEKSKFCNRQWKEHLEFLNVKVDDLWDIKLAAKQRNLINAKLFVKDMSLEDTLQLFLNREQHQETAAVYQQKFKMYDRYSIADVMDMIDYSAVFDSKRFTYAKVACTIIKETLTNNKELPLIPYFLTACAENWHFDVMNVLDEVLLCDTNSVVKSRTLSNMADLLGTMAGSSGGLRSGPGSNPSWSAGFMLLLKDDTIEGLKMLQAERSNWLDRPDRIMRAARHYERAAQILIQRSVNTVVQAINLNFASLPEIGSYIIAECPARIDMQGGWSDTPPICYELGGSVVNIAVQIDGKKPIGAKACRIKEPIITLKLGSGDLSQEIMIKDMKDVLNYDQPNAQGALLKAALVCTNIVDIDSKVSLSDQLMSHFQGGFFVQAWSLLPQGCGMGTSSILAGAIVSVLWRATGRSFSKLDVVHAVLYVEQLLTTGGGWQDQLSGVIGGINRGYSEAFLPLSVKAEPVIVPYEFIEILNAHFLLIYTGKVRLAKNLLQNVIRNWYAQEESVVKCFKDLISNSYKMKEAIKKGDLYEIGLLMNKYWDQKKILAPGCEPLIVKTMIKQLKSICYGQILVGAGGGGFMCILTKEPHAKNAVMNVLASLMVNQNMSIHTITIDMIGLELKE